MIISPENEVAKNLSVRFDLFLKKNGRQMMTKPKSNILSNYRGNDYFKKYCSLKNNLHFKILRTLWIFVLFFEKTYMKLPKYTQNTNFSRETSINIASVHWSNVFEKHIVKIL